MLKKMGLLLGCVLLLLDSWMTVLTMQSPMEKQVELIALADAEIEKGLYANAEPYLLDAAAYNTDYTQLVMERLKIVYMSLSSPQDYAGVLKKQTARTDCPAPAYGEYARYMIGQDDLEEALVMLKLGIERTGDPSLVDIYEEERYAFTFNRGDPYEDVTTYHSNGIQVKTDGLWGLANTSGKILIPCEYKELSTYDAANRGCVIARRPDESIVAVNLKNYIVAKTDLTAVKIGNFSQDIVSLQLQNGNWVLANSKLISNNSEFEDVGTCFNSAIAAKSGEKSLFFS